MTTLKLELTYKGNFVQLKEYLIIPKELNGTLFVELPLNKTIKKDHFLNELEGKGSECYGDITVTPIDLSKLEIEELQYLLGNSGSEYLENYLHQKEIEGIHSDEIKEKSLQLLEKLGLLGTAAYSYTQLISESFIKQKLKEVNKAF